MYDPGLLVKHNEHYRISGASKQRVPVELFVNEQLLPSDQCVERLVEIASDSNVVERVVVLPDIFYKNKNYVPGGVAVATRDVFVPMFSGPSNDAIALFQTDIPTDKLTDVVLDRFFSELQTHVGIYRRKTPVISEAELWKILCSTDEEFRTGWAARIGDLSQLDISPPLIPDKLSRTDIVQAFPSERPEMLPVFIPHYKVVDAGRNSLCVIDGNSHFIELCTLNDEIKPEVAAQFNLEENRVFVAIHAGSADVGLVAQKKFLYKEGRSDALDSTSEKGRQFAIARQAATRFGYANRFALMEGVIKAFNTAIDGEFENRLLSDAPHDFIENIGDNGDNVFLHRKGAVRALPAEHFHPDHPFGKYGKPFFFPSSPGNDSFIMINQSGNAETFHTCSHGAGRIMAMEEASSQFQVNDIIEYSASRNVKIYSFGRGKLASQSPSAFKPMEVVMATLRDMNLAEPAARLKPIAVIKT